MVDYTGAGAVVKFRAAPATPPGRLPRSRAPPGRGRRGPPPLRSQPEPAPPAAPPRGRVWASSLAGREVRGRRAPRTSRRMRLAALGGCFGQGAAVTGGDRSFLRRRHLAQRPSQGFDVGRVVPEDLI